MKNICSVLLIMMVSSAVFAQNKDAVLGKWINPTGEAYIEIYKKGNDRYSGKIVWLKEPKDEKGAIKTDHKNPDPKLRAKPVIGLEILNNFVYDDGKWTDGKIYDPKSGKTYSCNITLTDNGNLNIRGYIGISIIGRSEVWKKAK